uniref:Uncharacterized protein n=1 Tax=Romanomermis culicivorax TaxID=13658 RepID=A0A915JYD1_ROMCU
MLQKVEGPLNHYAKEEEDVLMNFHPGTVREIFHPPDSGSRWGKSIETQIERPNDNNRKR